MNRRLALVLTILFSSCPAFSQAPPPEWKNFTSMYDINGLTAVGGKVWAATTGGVFSYTPGSGSFAEYTTTEGLSNIQATAITSDSTDRILVGEANGSIDEMDVDGNVLRSQQDIATYPATLKQITDLSVVGDTIFACTQFGVVLISRANLGVLDTYLHFDPSQVSLQANCATVFKGRIYVGSQDGLSYALRSSINLAAPDLWNLTDTLGLGKGVTSLAVFDGSLIVGTLQGMFYTTDGVTFQPLSGAPAGAVYSLTPASGYLLVNSAAGLYKMTAGTPTFSALYTAGTQLNSVAAYSDTLAFAGTSNGLMIIGSSSRILYPPGPATNTVSNMTVDSSGNLWCSTNYTTNPNVAIMEFNGTTWTNYSKSDIPQLKSNQNIFRVSAVCGNRLMVGTWGYGLLMLSGDTGTYFNNDNSTLVGYPNNANYVIVGSAACDQSGNIWVTNPLAINGNTFSVYTPSDSTWHSFHNSLAPPSGFIPIAIDQFGGVWTGDAFGQAGGTGYSGLYYYNDNGTLTNLSDDLSDIFNVNNSSILSNQVNSVVVDNEDQVWIGTDLGLDVIYDPDPSAGFYIQSVYSLLDQNVNDITYDALDRKWVATNTGVYVISRDGNSTAASYNTTNSPLPSDQVKAIACDRKNGIVYMATEYGVTELKTGVEEPRQSLSKLKIFPDPALLPRTTPIHIEGLVANSEIKIFSVDGRLVDQFSAQGGKIAYWNGTDDSGNPLPSGIYLIVAYTSDGSQSAVAKIALIKH